MIRRSFMKTSLGMGTAALLGGALKADEPKPEAANEEPFKKIKIAQIGVRHEHASGKMNTLKMLPQYYEIVGIAKKFSDLGMKLFVTESTAGAISGLGIDFEIVKGIDEGEEIFELLESGKINYIVYTGALYDSTIEEFILLQRRALQLSISCLTSLDTARALLNSLKNRDDEKDLEPLALQEV